MKDWHDNYCQYAEKICELIHAPRLHIVKGQYAETEKTTELRISVQKLSTMLAWIASGEPLTVEEISGMIMKTVRDIGNKNRISKNSMEELNRLAIGAINKQNLIQELNTKSLKSWAVSYSARQALDGSEIESDFTVHASSLLDAYGKAAKTLEAFTGSLNTDPLYMDYVIWNIGIIDENVWPESSKFDKFWEDQKPEEKQEEDADQEEVDDQ